MSRGGASWGQGVELMSIEAEVHCQEVEHTDSPAEKALLIQGCTATVYVCKFPSPKRLQNANKNINLKMIFQNIGVSF